MPSYKTYLIRVPNSKQFNNIRVDIIIKELIKQLPVVNRDNALWSWKSTKQTNTWLPRFL